MNTNNSIAKADKKFNQYLKNSLFTKNAIIKINKLNYLLFPLFVKKRSTQKSFINIANSTYFTNLASF